MIFNVSFSFSAINDINHAFNWYEKQSPGLGWAFRNEIAICVEKINTDKISYRQFVPGAYKIGLKRFPYQLYFLKREETLTLTIIAVLHNRRHPSEIGKRL